MLNLVNPTHQLLVQYRASIDLTPSSILPPNIPSKGVEGSLKTSKGHKKKKHDEKPKEVVAQFVNDTVPTMIGKRVLKRTKNPTKKPSEFETAKPTNEPVVEIVVTQSKAVATEIPIQ